MRNLLDTKWSQLINTAPKNPTQTRYTRFLETTVKSDYDRFLESWESGLKDTLKTRYTDILENNNARN